MSADGSDNVHAMVAEEVNNRLEKAVVDIASKYASGKGGEDDSIEQPSGKAYQEAQAQKSREKREKKIEKESQRDPCDKTGEVHKNLDDDGDTIAEGGDDEDAELRMLRKMRLNQIKAKRDETIENLAKGHGQYREIVQDEFIAESTSSTRVLVHFYHRDFSRSTILDHHLNKLAARHIETKFVKINAEKALFFVDKLNIRVVPTLVYFIDGVSRGRMLGFEGLAEQMPEGKADEWPTIMLARLLAANNMINSKAIVDDDGIEEAMKKRADEARKSGMLKMMKDDFFSLDDDLDDFET